MAIAKIVFSGLSHDTTFSYTALGGVRFYDGAGNEIDVIGASIITDTALTFESSNVLITASDTYDATYYYVGGCFRNDKAITGGVYSNNDYWLSSNNDLTLTVEFKITIEAISKISYNPTPDYSYTNRGLELPFTVSAYDENGALLATYNITPDFSVNDTVYYIDTPELVAKTYILFMDSTNNLYYLDSTPSIQPLNKVLDDVLEDDFYNYGVVEPSVDVSLISNYQPIIYELDTTTGKELREYIIAQQQAIIINNIFLSEFVEITSFQLNYTGDVKVLVSDGVTWYYYDTTNSVFVETTAPSTLDLTTFDSANTAADFNSIPIDSLLSIIKANDTFGLAFLLTPTDTDNAVVNSIDITGTRITYVKQNAVIEQTTTSLIVTYDENSKPIIIVYD